MFVIKIKRFLTDPVIRLSYLSELGLFNHMSDRDYLKRKYQVIMHKELDLDNPQTFNEKLQWLKLYDRKPIYTTMVDKYEVKKYVTSMIGEKYIISTLGIWEHFDDVDFDSLPNQFVLKCTHDSGGLVICKDKSNFDKISAKKKIERCLKRNYYWSGREWPYKNVKPRIIAEKYMEDSIDKKLTDYKFYCFNGVVKFLYVSTGLDNHSTAQMSFYDTQFNKMPFRRSDYRELEHTPKKPCHFAEMIEIAEKLSGDIPFLRVDLYEIDEQIYFSELTFYPCSGLMVTEPEEWDAMLGEWLDLGDAAL